MRKEGAAEPSESVALLPQGLRLLLGEGSSVPHPQWIRYCLPKPAKGRCWQAALGAPISQSALSTCWSSSGPQGTCAGLACPDPSASTKLGLLPQCSKIQEPASLRSWPVQSTLKDHWASRQG